MNKTVVKKVLHLIGPYKLKVCLSILMAFCTVASSLYLPILIGNAVDCIVGAGQVDFTTLSKILLTMGAVIFVTAICQWGMNAINNSIVYSITADVRNRAFQTIERLPLSYLDRHQSGDIVSRVISDADQLTDGLLLGFTQLFTGVMTIIGTLAFMVSVNAWIALVVFVVTPLSLFVARFIANRSHAYFQAQSKSRGEVTAFVNEIVQNEKTVKAYGREKAVLESFDEKNARLRENSMKAVFFSSLVNPSTRFVNSLVYASVGLFGAFTVLAGNMTIGQLTCFLTYANQYTKPFNEISGVITELQNAFVCAERLFELIEEKTEEETETQENEEISKTVGHVEFDHVSFSYTPEQSLIRDLCLNVEPGQHIAIVGRTGCGKTTMINLLMRFYDVNEGCIRVDGKDIREFSRQDLRSRFGMVLQDTWLRKGTIRDNLIIGKPEATEEEILEASKATHAHSFIKRLPEGYDTVIGEDGGGLSQGQKQLLCITRIMLSLPPMLILDEATSSIDTRTEMRIQKTFMKMMDGRTTFIVAHRLSTIRNADRILVMDQGRVIEQGTHEELLAKNGFYTELYESQFKGMAV